MREYNTKVILIFFMYVGIFFILIQPKDEVDVPTQSEPIGIIVSHDTPINMFDTVITMVLHHEGKAFVDDKSINEVSRRGITLDTYKQFYGYGNYNSIKYLSEENAVAIYRKLFWDANNLDTLVLLGYPKTATVLMDSEVNIGPHRTNKYFQQKIGMDSKTQNGRIDSITISVLRKSNISDDELSKKIISERRYFYARLVKKKPVFEKYHNGWEHRLRSIEEFIDELT